MPAARHSIRHEPADPTACVVLDIDGVLADVRHRLHHLGTRPKRWDAFFAAAPDDALLDEGATLALRAASTHDIVYLTGRPERIRAATLEWLARHGLPNGRLLMRADDDRRPAKLVKLGHVRALRRERRVDLVVDDDPDVIDALRLAGFVVTHAGWMPRETNTLRDAQETEGRT